MKIEHIEKLDSIIDNPSQHNTEEKVNIVVRVLRDIALQVRGHYNDIALLRGMIETIQKTLESLDDKLFGNKESEGTIYTLKAQVDMMKKSFDISGTSNATNFTVTSPFIFNNPSVSNNVRPGFSEDNGTALAASRVDFVNGTRVMNIFSSGGAGAWTASGPKRAMAQFFVEI